MPLRKLWNALRGQNQSAAESSVTQQPREAASVDVQESNKTKVKPPANRPPAKSGRGILRLGRGPHDPLCRIIKHEAKNRQLASVLEIAVGDGTRAVAVVQAMSKLDPEAAIRYAAVDQFELVGGEVSLMQFHRDMRQHDIRPQIFPCEIKSGLTRVAHTIGAVDLVLVSEDAVNGSGLSENDWSDLINRVSHQGTIVLRQQGDQWSRVEASSVAPAQGLRRAA